MTPLCAAVGISVASLYAKIGAYNALLLITAMFFANMSVNVINDYTDYKRGIDKETVKTKFSGGRSGLLAKRLIKPRQTLLLGLVAAAIAAAIGAYFVLKYPILLPFVAVGALAIFFYTSHFVNVPFLAELLLVLVFTLVPLGGFIAMTGSLQHIENAIIPSASTGILVGMVLLVNGVPDRDVDKKYGRKSGAVLLYKPTRIAKYYLSWQAAAIAILLLGAFFRLIPVTALIALISTPLMLMTFKGIRHYKSPSQFEKYMGIDVVYFLTFVSLLSTGLLVG